MVFVKFLIMKPTEYPAPPFSTFCILTHRRTKRRTARVQALHRVPNVKDFNMDEEGNMEQTLLTTFSMDQSFV
jgi:hypothetical protein